MLQQKQKEVPYIAVFKVGSGEEFIAKVVDETMIAYRVEKPLCMVATETGLRFAPFLMMADPDKAVNVPKPVVIGEPASKLEEQYEQATSSIALPRRS
jgi:hypothetical protein